MSAARLGLDAPERARDDRRHREPEHLQRERARVDPGELEEVVDEERRGRAPARAERGRTPRASARSSSTASSIACMLASGVRRSWLAQATSSRRVSKRRRRLSPISLKEEASSATSAGPCSGTRTSRSPRASSTDASRTRSIEPDDRPREHERGDHRGERRSGRDRQDLHVLAHVEHHPAGEQHGAERQQDGEERQPGELQAHGREKPQQVARTRGRPPA